MTTNPKTETCILRVENLNGHPQGTGFILTPTLAVTCAHVVHACRAGPGDRVRLSFQAGGVSIEAEALADGWHEDADVEAGRITINVTGSPHTRRDFLAIIRSHFDHIHRTLSGLPVTEIIPIPGHPGIYEEYSHLLMLERAGEQTLFPRGLAKRIPIQPLLDGIEPPIARRTRRDGPIYNVDARGAQIGVIGDNSTVKDGIHFDTDK